MASSDHRVRLYVTTSPGCESPWRVPPCDGFDSWGACRVGRGDPRDPGTRGNASRSCPSAVQRPGLLLGEVVAAHVERLDIAEVAAEALFADWPALPVHDVGVAQVANDDA